MSKGRPKGGTNKYWTAEEKYKAIKPILEFEKSSSQVTKETGINNGMLSVWVKKYNEGRLKELENQKKAGNPLSKYSKKKNLTELENMKLRINKARK